MVLSSGDVGYCEKLGKPIGIVISCNDNTVIDLDCDHKTCGYTQICKLYQRHPVGFRQVDPLSDD